MTVANQCAGMLIVTNPVKETLHAVLNWHVWGIAQFLS